MVDRRRGQSGKSSTGITRGDSKPKKLMRKNILFNTTRQWNPGDQIIMLGILRLLRHLDFNIFIYNRHPNAWGHGVDNSYRPKDHSLENIDYYITAGTPEWASKGLQPLFRALVEAHIPHSFIGVGSQTTDETFNFPSLMKLLETADVLTARDKEAYRTIAPLGGILLPCPGFLCGELPTKARIRAKTVGLIYMSSHSKFQQISSKLDLNLIVGYEAVIKKHNTIIICHYIDEALEARFFFPNTPIYYSYDAKDFQSFYALCDLVIGPRLHGVLLAAGMGIPSYITRDYDENQETRRVGTTEPLGIPSLLPADPMGFVEAIKNTEIRKESKRLIDLRYKTEIEYLGVLAEKIPSLFGGKILCLKIAESIRSLLNTRRKLNELP